jgi:sortase A
VSPRGSVVTSDLQEIELLDWPVHPERVVEPEVREADDRPPVRAGAPVPKIPVVLAALALTLCVVVVFGYLFATVFSGFQEQREQRQLYAQLRGLLSPSSPDAPKIGGSISAGFPVALMSAPRADIDNLVVVEGSSPSDLLAGPGHLSDTPLPGQRGNSVLVGRSTTAGGPFGSIKDLKRGDTIKVVTGQGTFHYVVADTRTGSKKPSKLKASSVLTLVTGTFSWSLSSRPNSANLFYVDAVGKTKPAVAPPGRPRAGSSQLPGSNDGGGLPLALGWLVALFAVSGICWWLWARWGLLRTWLIGAPVLLAVLWMLSSEVMRLLPNVY